MGMFDEIKIKADTVSMLPDTSMEDKADLLKWDGFQTKSLYNMMYTIRMTANNGFTVDKDEFYNTEAKEVLTFSGMINFGCILRKDGYTRHGWFEYNAHYIDGKILKIERIIED